MLSRTPDSFRRSCEARSLTDAELREFLAVSRARRAEEDRREEAEDAARQAWTVAMLAARPARSEPPLPPQAPGFQPVLRRIAEITAERGASEAAAWCRRHAAGYDAMLASGDDMAAEWMLEKDFTAFDLSIFSTWLKRRAAELMGGAPC